MISFSFSLMTRDLRSGPATIRSRASSNSGMLIVLRLRRAARIAASFTRVARSAPENPGDWRGRRAGEPGRLAGQVLDDDVLVEGLALRVDLEDRGSTLHVRSVEDDLTVEAAR